MIFLKGNWEVSCCYLTPQSGVTFNHEKGPNGTEIKAFWAIKEFNV